MAKAVVIILAVLCCTCAATGVDVNAIRAHKRFGELSQNEKQLVEAIMSKAVSSPRREYYFSKLTLLLNTPTLPIENIKNMNVAQMEASVQRVKEERRTIAGDIDSDLEEYLNIEETYEMQEERHWRGYCPDWPYGSCFYVVDDDPSDILVHIQVHLVGPIDLIEDVLSLEDSIEKHLSVPGFNVNLVFVGRTGRDVFTVKIDPTEWTTSENWAGSDMALAHELMHLMGLPDEYDRIENHAGNKYMDVEQRLLQFLVQMNDTTSPTDAANGIMCRSWKRPLDRHVCAAVGLDEECVKARQGLH